MDYLFGLGVTVKDTITGYKGVITGRADYITGCNQYLITPKSDKGSMPESHWFDENRLKSCGLGIIKIKIGPEPGGPVQNAAPIK